MSNRMKYNSMERKKIPVYARSKKKVAQSVFCKRSQVLQMCVIRATSYSLLCWLR